jgi:hypothetical protein
VEELLHTTGLYNLVVTCPARQAGQVAARDDRPVNPSAAAPSLTLLASLLTNEGVEEEEECPNATAQTATATTWRSYKWGRGE